MKLVFENRINEAKITDYIDRDQLTDIVFNKNKEKFGNPKAFKCFPNMFLQTIYDPANDGSYSYRYWKCVKNDDGNWEVTETNQVGQLIEPRVNFVLTESVNRMNEDIQSKEEFMGLSKELADEIKYYLSHSYGQYISNDLLKLLYTTQDILLMLAKGKNSEDIPSDRYII